MKRDIDESREENGYIQERTGETRNHIRKESRDWGFSHVQLITPETTSTLFLLVLARARQAPPPARQRRTTFLLASDLARLFALVLVFFPG
jgi:hypothetical protein